jgi:polo-like kinase 1
LESKGNVFNYIERRPTDKQEMVTSHTLTDYPKELNKKVTLLKNFKSYLEGDDSQGNKDINEKDNNFGMKKDYNDNKNVTNDNNNNTNTNSDKKSNFNFVYVKKWLRSRHAIIFRLSNKVVQVCFQDHTEIILSSESRVVTYVNKKGERCTYPLSSALESNNYEMTKRLKYTKDILTHMVTPNNQNQNKETERVGNNDPLKEG